MQIKELQDGMRRINFNASVIAKGDIREIRSRFKNETYRICDAVLEDKTGQIKLTLWNDQIETVNVGDYLIIENAYVTSFRQELQVNVGKFGKILASKNSKPTEAKKE